VFNLVLCIFNQLLVEHLVDGHEFAVEEEYVLLESDFVSALLLCEELFVLVHKLVQQLDEVDATDFETVVDADELFAFLVFLQLDFDGHARASLLEVDQSDDDAFKHPFGLFLGLIDVLHEFRGADGQIVNHEVQALLVALGIGVRVHVGAGQKQHRLLPLFLTFDVLFGLLFLT